jgi:hypothetical protein
VLLKLGHQQREASRDGLTALCRCLVRTAHMLIKRPHHTATLDQLLHYVRDTAQESLVSMQQGALPAAVCGLPQVGTP